MKPYIIDAETNIKNRGEGSVGTMEASPYHPDNKIVLFGEGKQVGKEFDVATFKSDQIPYFLYHAKTSPVLLVGHNITFDLKYVAKTWPEHWKAAISNIYIWDTQQVAYLLSGQTHMYPSLDQLCAEIGHVLKDEKIKAYWEAGVDTEMIPADELEAYLRHDIRATAAVFRFQYEVVRALPNLFNLIRVKSDDMLMTSLMESNGMFFDIALANTISSDLSLEIKEFEEDLLLAASANNWPVEKAGPFNPLSPEHVSLLLFGGPITYKEDVVQIGPDGNPIVYKTGAKKGLPKTKKHEKTFDYDGIGLVPLGEPNKKGIYSTSEEVLSELKHPVADAVLELRALYKDVETYYKGYSKLVWPDGLIHPNINHCSTRTGRQSCTQPNLQNASKGD